MSVELKGLPDDPAELRKVVEQLIVLVEKQGRDIARYKQTIAKLQRLHFGAKSEKLDPLQQHLQFDPGGPEQTSSEAASQTTESSEAVAGEAEPGQDGDGATPRPKRKGHGRRRVPATIRRLTVEYTLPPEQRVCTCGLVCEPIGDESSEQLDWVPSSFVVLRKVRIKYGCKPCEGRITTAPAPDAVIEKGIPGSGLLAHVITSKYADHLPLYRLERIFNRHGFSIPRSTMCGWIDLCADLLSPIVACMWSLVMKSRALHTDDTIVPIQDRDRDTVRKGRLWVYCGDVDHPYILYEYTPDHLKKYPVARLGDYRGYIHADGYSAYATVCDNVVRFLVACWTHARRYFFEAQTNDRVRALTALAFIQELYAVEKLAKKEHLTPEARLVLRQERSIPVLGRLKSWLDEQVRRVLPGDAIGKAIAYTLRRWPDLVRYTTNGRLKIDNGTAERAVRDIAIGRKNWLFAQNDEGGHRAAVLYTIVQTCKRHGIDVFDYIRDVLERVSTHPASRIEELVPGKWVRATVPVTERAAARPAA